MQVSYKRRTRSGTALVEFCGVLIVSVPIFLAVVDLGYIALGAQMNDTVCRDATRAASEGPPAGTGAETSRTLDLSDKPYQRALEVIENFYCTNLPAKVRDSLTASESLVDVPPATMGGQIDGQVSIETTVDIYPPFVVGALLEHNKVTLTAKHSIPYTYIEPQKVSSIPTTTKM